MQGMIFCGVLGLLIMSGLAAPDRGYAWGDVAHQVICEIAFQELTPPARTEVRRLLGTELNPTFRRFANACTWADHPRKRPTEHYLNLPRTHMRVTAADQTCPLADSCLLTAIEVDTAVLTAGPCPECSVRDDGGIGGAGTSIRGEHYVHHDLQAAYASDPHRFGKCHFSWAVNRERSYSPLFLDPRCSYERAISLLVRTVDMDGYPFCLKKEVEGLEGVCDGSSCSVVKVLLRKYPQ